MSAPEITCTRTDEFADMYTEFAPEPIVVPCRQRATCVLTILGDVNWVVCTEHAVEMVTGCAGMTLDFLLRPLCDEDKRQYAAGRAAGEAEELSEDAMRTILYRGIGETNLCTPEHSHELYDTGWMDALAERTNAWHAATVRNTR